jgi:hypothetical protein
VEVAWLASSSRRPSTASLFGPQWHWLGTRRLGLRLGGDHLCPQRQSLQGPQAKHTSISMATRRRVSTSTNKSEESRQEKAKVRDLHFGVHPGLLHRAIRHALLGCDALRALLGYGVTRVRRLGCFSASDDRDDGNILPHSLGGCPTGLRYGRGWTVAPACDKGHMNIQGPATPDKQRLQAPRGGARFCHWHCAWRRRRI